MHIEALVEEPSMKSALENIFPKILDEGHSFRVITFQGKTDLLKNISKRLEGYSKWIPDDYLIIVIIDRDGDDCLALKNRMESVAAQKGLTTKSTSKGQAHIHVLNRIVIEELEAWFFGDVQAICDAFPGIPISLAKRNKFRDPDNIKGGTWEALERVLQEAGYYSTGLAKIDAAQRISSKMDPRRNRSKSFNCFVDGMSECIRANAASNVRTPAASAGRG